jgi:hypothetical protein
VTTVGLSLTAASAPYLPPLLPSVEAASVDPAAIATWRSQGWPCPDRLGTLSLFDARTLDGGPTTLHLTYSDGLSTASLFVQRGRLADSPSGAVPRRVGDSTVLVRPGRPRQLIWAADGYVLTVVTDTPRDLLPTLLGDLPRAEQDPTGWSRVVHGAARLVSWLDPFD